MSTTCCAADEIPDADEEPPVRPPWWRDPALLPSTLSGLALVAGLALEWRGLDTAGTLLLWVSLLAGASTFVPDTIRRLLRGGIGVGLLMTIAAVGAVALGHVGEAAALAFLFSLAETLEDRSMSRAREGLRALLTLIPETARVARPPGDRPVGARSVGEHTVPAADLRRGDVVIVGAGERVATDGVVAEGRSALDVSSVTGESVPVAVSPGDPAPAGAINTTGTLRIEATADGTDNSLTRIVTLVQQAQSRKGAQARLADRIARPLVPGVLVVAALVALLGAWLGDPAVWIERALVVLVAASPCALAIAVPVTVISAIGSASKYGVVITSGQAFEQLGTIRTVAFDKTGTLTRNEPVVVDVVVTGPHSREEVLGAAAALEASSTHPLAAAITTAAGEVGEAGDVAETAGLGLTGRVGGAVVRVGSTRWLGPAIMVDDAERMAEQGMTVVAVEIDDEPAGLIGIRDELRTEVPETLRMLDRMGVRSVMLTGDDQRTARALAATAGIDDVRAGQLPGDKAAAVQALSERAPTAMVGDGINDAPALATATVGIAIGTTGSAAAIESADVAFTGRDLRLLPGALAHARRGRRIMTWNVGLSVALIVVLFPLALTGTLGLAGVVLVHEVAEVLVIANGLRAARRGPVSA